MSGGSMQYLYATLLHGADFPCDTPEREAFAKHLRLVAQALHDIEWVDSGDYGPGDEVKAILACIGDTGGTAAPEKSDDPWTWCAEKMPPEAVSVLIFSRNVGYTVGYAYQGIMHDANSEMDPDAVWWMPLPDAPEEQK